MLILLALNLLFFFAFLGKKFRKIDAIIYSWVGVNFFIGLSLQLLSLFDSITRLNVVLISGIFCLLLIHYCVKTNIVHKIIRYDLSFFNANAFIVSFCFILLTFFIISIFKDVNNIDVNVYHLPRVRMWIQNQNLNHFFTTDDRLLAMPPQFEWLLLFKYIIDQSHFGLIAISVYSYLVLGVTIHGITKLLNSTKTHTLVITLFFLLSPSIVLNTVTVKNHIFLTSLLSIFLYSIIRLRKEELNRRELHIVGLALTITAGLLINTKTTALIFIGLGTLFIVPVFSKFRQLITLKFYGMSLAIFMMCISFHFTHNFKTYGSILGKTTYGTSLINEPISAKAMISNTTRYLASNLWTPVNSVNQTIYSITHLIITSLDLEINDIKNTWMVEGAQFTQSKMTTFEDTAGSPLQIFCIIAASFIAPFLIYRNSLSKLAIASLLVYWGIILSTNLILKYQVWHVRLLFPPMIFLVPFALESFQLLPKKLKLLPIILLSIAVVQAVPFIFSNMTGPLISKRSFTFSHANPSIPGSQNPSIIQNRFSSNYQFIKPMSALEEIIEPNCSDANSFYTESIYATFFIWRALDETHGFGNYTLQYYDPSNPPTNGILISGKSHNELEQLGEYKSKFYVFRL